MKFHFEPNLDYQHAAIESVCDLFKGQEVCRTEFTVTKNFGQLLLPVVSAGSTKHSNIGTEADELGIGNRLQLLDHELLKNLTTVQVRNGLMPSPELESGDFTIEMETGTGKTYVYLRTIFELNRRYGFLKFVIVVPSIAIKEGVYKSLQMTEEHFRAIYANAPCEYFLYDSSKLGQVRNFATSTNIQIMIVTVGAINKKDVNNLYKDNEKTGGERPIDLIRATRPVLIVDEPQKVDGGLEGSGRKAIKGMNPLCTLRYSATHADKHQMLYRLDAVDAYEKKLVKQIEVASLEVEGGHNKGYIKLLSTSNKGGHITAKVELDVQQRKTVSRKSVQVRPGDDLQQVTGRNHYDGCIVQSINTKTGEECIELSTLDIRLEIGDSIGDVDSDAIKRLMIKRTIEEHLDKELRLRPLGIKVLTLFFIDLVEHYRKYTPEGEPLKGKYALMFEEEYKNAISNPKYRTLFNSVDLDSLPSEVHNGYFSIDKKGRWTDTTESNQTQRDNAERAYNLIMREKELLLDFKTKLKFIFSHSALREGWDNPNIFQICVIRDMSSDIDRRQSIGRGLRLCVNQAGERVRGFDVNTLTIVANESYELFADNLQKEIEQDTGITFGIVEKTQFAFIPVTTDQGETIPLGVEKSIELWNCLNEVGYIDGKGRIQESLKVDIKSNSVQLPDEFSAHQSQIMDLLRKLAGKLDIKNANERLVVKTKQAVLHSQEFQELWERIKYRTTYRVKFDNEELIDSCVEAIWRSPPISKTKVTIRKADIAIGREGISTEETSLSAPITLNESDFDLPDLITDLQDKTQLTRKSIVKILTASRRLDDFMLNPQQFIELAADAINRTKRLALVDGIKYQLIGSDHYFAQELFENEELIGYLKNMLPVRKSVFEQIVYDSAGVERSFAEQLDKNEAVKLFMKLPAWFRVPTPLGNYNPDWAVLVDDKGSEKLFLVVETKASLFAEDLRDKESAKIRCGRAHFEALAVNENPAKFIVARDVSDLMNYVS